MLTFQNIWDKFQKCSELLYNICEAQTQHCDFSRNDMQDYVSLKKFIWSEGKLGLR